MFDGGSAYLIEMQSISKAFGPASVLRDVSLRLRPGSVHALMGENGAGKSTLMKILAGVHHSDAGQILKDGKPPATCPRPCGAGGGHFDSVFRNCRCCRT